METAKIELLQQIRNDPWYWLHYVHTLDQAEKKQSPIKKYPVHLLYLKPLVRIWQTEPLLIVPKSRRMKVSWTIIACYTHEAQFNVGRRQAFVSKKEDDANELVERAAFIIKNMAEDYPKEFIPKYKQTHCKLDFPELNSVIEAYPSGANQLREYTFSGIFFDEMAFLENAREIYSASFPTIEGGGRMTGVSSPNPGFFKSLVFDKLNESI